MMDNVKSPKIALPVVLVGALLVPLLSTTLTKVLDNTDEGPVREYALKKMQADIIEIKTDIKAIKTFITHQSINNAKAESKFESLERSFNNSSNKTEEELERIWGILRKIEVR